MRRRTARALAALADGSLRPERREALRRRVSGSGTLARALEQQLVAVEAIRGLAASAPPALRAWVERATLASSRTSPIPKPRRPDVHFVPTPSRGRAPSSSFAPRRPRTEPGALGLSRLLVHSGVILAILIATAAVIVQSSFRHSSRVETPSTLLRDQSLWWSQVRLVGFVSPGSMNPRLNGVRFVLADEGGTGRMTVDYAGEIPNELRGGRVVGVTGSFDGHAFEAQPNTLVVICGRSNAQQHC